MANRIQLRRDSSTNWSTNNPTLFEGEVGLELDTRKIKVGNGTAAWNDLLYSNVTPEQLASSIPSSVEYLSVDQSGRLVASNQNGFIIDAPAYIGNAESENNRIATQGTQQTLSNKTLNSPSITNNAHIINNYNNADQTVISLETDSSIRLKPYGPYNNMESSIMTGYYGGLTISSDSSIQLNAQVGDVISFTSSANTNTNFIEINPYASRINFNSSGSASAYIQLPGHGSQALYIDGQEVIIGALSIKPGYGTVKVNNQDVATQNWVTNQSYATQNWVTNQSYATQNWVTNQSYATQSYVGTQVSNLVNSAPATLDTLKELADSLADDPNFATTITNLVGTKIASSQKGAANGVATLDSNGQVPLTQLGNASGGTTASIHSFAMIG